ncbi:MAG: flagellar assembly protein FliX [Alphaproteobacteria bacterium]
MKIEATGPVGTRASQRRDKASSARSSEFARHMAGEATASATSVAGNAPIGAVDALLLLQGVDDSTSEQANGRARARGQMLLDRLDEIRHGLLMGSIPRETLNDMARLARLRKETATDAALADVLGEIELRAEVELAKLGHDN